MERNIYIKILTVYIFASLLYYNMYINQRGIFRKKSTIKILLLFKQHACFILNDILIQHSIIELFNSRN